MSKLLVLAAIKDEFLPSTINSCEVFYTGIGKINATYATTRLIYEVKPDLIFNIGTAGTMDQKYLGKIHKIGAVIEHDVKCEPLSPRGKVPFDHSPSVIPIFSEGLLLATGDSFITEPDPWLKKNKIDLVDMECFAIAKVAYNENVPFFSVKYASDMADSNADKDWLEVLTKNPIDLEQQISIILEELNV